MSQLSNPVPFQPLNPSEASLKVIVWGPPGSGKTIWSLNADDVAYISLESGADRYSHLRINATYPKNLKELGEVLRFLKSADHSYQTIVVDTISNVWGMFLEEFCPENKKPDWVLIKTKWKRMLRAFLSLRQDVIFIGRAKDARSESNWYKKTGDLVLDSESSTSHELDFVAFSYTEMHEETGEVLYKVRLDKVRDITGRIKTGMVLINSSFREFKRKANTILEEAELPEDVEGFLEKEQLRREIIHVPEGLEKSEGPLLS